MREGAQRHCGCWKTIVAPTLTCWRRLSSWLRWATHSGNTFKEASLDRHQAAAAFRFVLGNLPILEESETVSEVALQLAVAHGCTYYDCLYLALAMERRCDLITADEKFFFGGSPRFPDDSTPDSSLGTSFDRLRYL